jgi:lipopolysaccharide assembly outer membrane protein LptD (OstA)
LPGKITSYIIVVSLSLVSALVSAGGMKNFIDQPGASLANTRADSWKIVGDNIVAKGNVFIPYGKVSISCDKAIVNIKNKDIEASGNIRFYVTKSEKATLTPAKFAKVSRDPNSLVVATGYEVDPLGYRKIKVKVYSRGDALKAEKVVGNLATGMMQFEEISGRYKTFIMQAKSGIRKPSGEIIVKDAEISSCSYMFENNSHYSISCGTAKIYPHTFSAQGLQGYNADRGEHSVWAYNCKFNVFGVPILWVPVVYKPKEESPGLFNTRGGYDSDWGAWWEVSKGFQLSDYPDIWGKVYGVLMSKRGFGYGADVDINTANSRTQFSAFSIYDSSPYEEHSKNKRLAIPSGRYDFRLSHLTHVTPRLDFRGTMEFLSDYYMLNDFFYGRSTSDIEPETFASLEYQFNRASVSAMIRPKINSFFTVTQKLPELRVDVPRQELFSNIYYQGKSSFEYLKMSWRTFDRKPTPIGVPFADPKDYESARFDMVHFLYYPINLKYLNIVPRIGGRMTYYSKSSKQKVSSADLGNMFEADDPNVGYSTRPLVDYDDKGGSQFRLAGEIGVEANTKIYQAWQDVKSAFFQIDGFRHVLEPYINYTYIPEPTVSREKLYYFDEVDRLKRVHFVRFGMRNRLQTRTDSFLNPGLREWFSMENYIDVHFYRPSGFNNMGNFDSLLTFSPTSNLDLTGKMSIDLGQNSDHNVQAVRNKGRLAGRPGMDNKWINQLQLEMKYKFMEDMVANLAYAYQDRFQSAAAYSMGSTLTQINAGRLFDKMYDDRTQQITAGIKMPLTPDRKTFLNASVYYDFEQGSIENYRIQILRNLHCWTVGLEYYADWDRESNGDKDWNHNFMATLTLNTALSPLQKVQSQGWKQSQKLNQGGN